VRSRLFAWIAISIVVTTFAEAQKTLPDAVSDLASQIATHVAKEQKKKIAVIPFRELGGAPTVFGTYLAEELVTDLVNTGNLDLVERSTLDKVFGELKLSESGAIDPSTAKQVGKLTGADAIVTGTITDLQSYVGVNCRLIDTETGRIFAAAQARIVKDDDVKKIMTMPVTSGPQEGGQISPRVSDSHARPPAKRPIFETESYRLVADSLHKAGNNATLYVGLESLSDKTTRFEINACYLLDENGERWEALSESAGFFPGLDMIPGTRVRSKYALVAKESNNGTRFTFICNEGAPSGGRKVIVPGISAQ
jgi:TolB-like protein